jgi:hypothetical protein
MAANDSVAVRSDERTIELVHPPTPTGVRTQREPSLSDAIFGRGRSLALLMERLQLSPTLVLPLDAFTQTFAVVAPRTGGRTHAAAVLVEEMVSDRLPVVIVDSTGTWHGLRRATNGKDPGLPVRVLGGQHGEMHFRADAGSFVADWAIALGQPLVLDVSSLPTDGARRFLADFADQVCLRRPRAMHLVLDDAMTLTGVDGAFGHCPIVNVIRSAVTEVGVTLVSEGLSLLNRHILSNVDVLIAARITERADQDAVRGWVERVAGREAAQRVVQALDSLPADEAWVCSRSWLDMLERVRLRHRATCAGLSDRPSNLRPPQSEAAVKELERLRGRLGQTLTGAATLPATPEEEALHSTSLPRWSRVERQSGPLEAKTNSEKGRRGRPIEQLILSHAEKGALQSYAGAGTPASAVALRARIILECAQGRLNGDVARELGVTNQMVGKWRRRFVERRLQGLWRNEPSIESRLYSPR